MRKLAPLLALVVALAGCARTPGSCEDPDDERLRETMEAAEQGPSTWSPAVTIPLYPVLLVTHTTIDVAKATYRYFRDLFGGGGEPVPVPERVEKQAEKIPKN
jgi:hypothetical protein